jgi:AGZA family xanthine/uracil permease-like MFS transporter
MASIVVLNPLIIGSFAPDDAAAHKDVPGNILPVPQVAAVMALVAGVMTIMMGLVANYPFAIAIATGSASTAWSGSPSRRR